MSWWRKLLGRRASRQQAGEAEFPVHIDLVPSELSARVYLHEITDGSQSVPCWSYVSDGLMALKQKEVIFTLRRGRDESVDAFPHDPFHLFTTLYRLAAQGQLVDVGGFTQFGSKSFFGHHLAYLQPQPLAGVPFPQSAVTALLITLDELRALQEFGPTRLMARLGQSSRYYPCPPWSDRWRRGLSFERTFQESVLMKTTRIKATGVRVQQAENRITMTIPRGNPGEWRQRLRELPADMPVAALADLDPSADGCLVWEPGQTGPAAITPPGSQGSRVGGCFILFVPEQPADGGQVFEDGFAVTLTTPSWEAVRRALIDDQALSVPVTGDGLAFSIEGREETYVNPVDHKLYVAPDGWNTYRPHAPRTADSEGGKVTLGHIRLLTAENDIASRTTVEDLSAFCNEVRHSAEHSLGGSQRDFKLLVQFRCTTTGHQVQIAHEGDAVPQLLQAFYDALVGIPKLPVRQDDVAFQVQVVVSS